MVALVSEPEPDWAEIEPVAVPESARRRLRHSFYLFGMLLGLSARGNSLSGDVQVVTVGTLCNRELVSLASQLEKELAVLDVVPSRERPAER